MKTAFYLVASSAFVLALAHVSGARESKGKAKLAGSPERVVYDASSAFEFLKTLSGNWERTGGHDHGTASKSTTFRVSGAGSSVVETIFPGDPNEMVTVYHMDGDDLLLTHYCALHNAPVMKFQKTNTPGEIKFVFHGGTNFDPKSDMHVHEGAYRIKNDGTLEADFVVFNEGKASEKVNSILKRRAK